MLRASIEYGGADADVRGIADGAKAGDTGIAHGELLMGFVDAAMQGDPARLASARNALRDAAGSEAVVDAAAVLGNFERMVRIADGTGIPLENLSSALTGDIREALGLDDFRSRRVMGAEGIIRVFGPIARSIVRVGLHLARRRARKT